MAEAKKLGCASSPLTASIPRFFNASTEIARSVRKLWLTASGGPFRTTPKAEFAGITVERALKHSLVGDGPQNHD